MQKTNPGQGYHIHYEDLGRFENGERCLVYSLYLNDVEDAGETEFLYLKKRYKPKKNKIDYLPLDSHIRTEVMLFMEIV